MDRKTVTVYIFLCYGHVKFIRLNCDNSHFGRVCIHKVPSIDVFYAFSRLVSLRNNIRGSFSPSTAAMAVTAATADSAGNRVGPRSTTISISLYRTTGGHVTTGAHARDFFFYHVECVADDGLE